MTREQLVFETTRDFSKILDKNYFIKVRDFNTNTTINYILSENLKRFNPNLNHTFNIYFNENNIKIFKIEYDKIYFEIHGYIINLYFISQDHFKSKKEYMDFNCGLLLNEILKIFNLKYNFTGLYYVYVKNKTYNEYYITKLQESVIELIGLDFTQYKHGFDNETEMFNWLLKSPYINTNEILFNNKIKNKIFIQFKKFIKDNKINNVPDFSQSILDDMLFTRFRNESEIKNFILLANKKLITLI
jgi:hypothetical protein